MPKDRYHINGDCEHLGHVFSPTQDSRWECVLCHARDYTINLDPAVALSQKCMWDGLTDTERAKHSFLACYCPKCLSLDSGPRLI